MGEAKQKKEAMKGTLLDPAVSSGLVSFAYEMTCEGLDLCKNDVDALITAYKGRYMNLDIAADGLPKGTVGCGPSCSACCHQLVVCSPFEVFIVAQNILLTFPVDRISQIKDALGKLSAIPMEAAKRYSPLLPCPLLDDNKCSVYSARPAVCRVMYSDSRRHCEEALHGKREQINYLADPRILDTALGLGIEAALHLRRGYHVEHVELAGSLLVVLNNFEGTLQGWMSGKDVFPEYKVRPPDIPSRKEMIEIAKARGLFAA